MTYKAREAVLKKMAELEAKEKAAQQPTPQPTADYSQFSDAVPELKEGTVDKVVERQTFIDNLKILDVWQKMGGKPPRHIGSGQSNGVMVFCLNPQHDNTNTEAAQLDLSKNLFVCHGCDAGGGVVAVAALSDGNTGTGKGRLRAVDFAKAEEKLLMAYGWERTRSSGGKTDLLPPYQPTPEPKAKPEPKVETSVPKPEPLATVTPITEEHEDAEPEVEQEQLCIVPFNWRETLPKDTFLYSYMEAASHDDSVEAFHFGYALSLLGAAVGRKAILHDTYNLGANVYVALIGDSGTGKTKSANAMRHVLDAVLPYDPEEEPQVGARFVSNPASGGGLVQAFIRSIKIPPTFKVFERRGQVKAVIDYGELESLTSRMQKDATGLRSTLMDLFDGKPHVGSIAKGDGDNGHYCDDAFCSQITSLQPRNIPNLLSNKDLVSGTINRYMFFGGEYKKREPRGTSILPFFDPAIAHLEKIRDWGQDSDRLLDWSDDAGPLYDHWHEFVLEPERIKSTDMLNRAEVHIKKLCLLFAINSMHDKIESIDVIAALSLWPWMLSLFHLVDKSVGTPELTQLEEKVLTKVKSLQDKTKKEVGMGVLRNHLNSNGAGYTREDVSRALKNLTLSGELGVCEPGRDRVGNPLNKRGPKAERWYVA